jgi:proteasome lid subunit RPN8/RPN11
MESVIIDPGGFSSLILSAVEVYSKETTGLLVGKHDKKFVKGRLTPCVVVQGAYPLQTAWRGFTSVMVGNKRAFVRARRTLDNLGFELLGEYHSHPGASARLTSYDVDYIRDQLSERDKKTLKLEKKQWLELIIGIKSRTYTKEHELGWFPLRKRRKQRKRMVAGILKNSRKGGYYIEIIGYWVNQDTSEQIDVYYSPY